MLTSRFRVLVGLLAFAPGAFAQDDPQAIDAAPRFTRTGGMPQFPPAPATSSPGAVTVYHTNIATSATSDVPGLLGTKFAAGNVTSAFEKQWFSPDGLHYTFRGDTPLATTLDAVVILDSTLLWQEGTVTPYASPELWGPGTNRMGINNAGDVALAHNIAPTAVNDDYILRWNAGSSTYSVLAQELGAISFLPPTVTWDDSLDSVNILTDGRVLWRAVGIDGTGITLNVNDEILVLDTTLIARTSIDVPAGQAGGGTAAWQNFGIDNTWISPDGANLLIDGDTDAVTNDDVLVYNGNVVIQEGIVLPGTSFVSPVASGGPAEVSMDSAGRWFARGNNVVTAEDWVVRNGVLIATTDTPIAVNDERVYMSATINEAQETPPSGSLATGIGRFLVDTASNQLYYDITLTGLVGENAAHIHGFSGPGVPSGVLYSLPLGNQKDGVITYLESEEGSILAGLAYVNIHTATFPGGEIRGQILVAQEQWDDADFAACYFAHTGNAAGDYLVAGVTNAPSAVNGVVVLNGTTVILREGDPVDVDGNGLYDDNAFLQNFGNDDFTLLEDGSVAFSCTLRDAAGTAFAQGIFKRKPGNFQRALCFGDGSGTACPCANNSIVGQMAGCVNSFGLAGRLDSIGTASIAADTLVLQGSQVPNGPGLYFQGTNIFAAGAGISFGDGLICAGGTIIRMGVVFAAGNVSAYPGGTTPAPIHIAGATASGDLRTYQLWYRDGDITFCSPAAFNLTNAIEVVWGP
ncbi:MAG: CHRD domain-containing protein [Planctomycetota bacterium]|nr:CHRD domain-containing protein [Planctomycetota bacterium]